MSAPHSPHCFGPFVVDLHRVERASGTSEVVRLRKHSGDSISPAVYFDPSDLIWVVTALQAVQSRIHAGVQ